ncbi:MAG: bifunctional oligoribonuclease/PAP phosphatase NrnA [Myxococcota bacterium]|jgi:phosphoesterase RecJ-like protein|nr:bifunctional oligoribonuclease/PAP phosphatase NrnA [Myxococcota bacterium]
MSPDTHSCIAAPNPALQQSLSQAVELLRDARHILVAAHAHPDGDAVGSSLAMAALLRPMGKEVTVFNVDPIPFNFQFLPGAESWRRELDASQVFDLSIVLDVAAEHLLGAVPHNFWGKRRMVIDHHQQRFPGADLLVHDPDASATGELIYRLACALSEPLNPELARCLYCALVSDTGSFRYSSTSPTALGIAARLVEAGVDVWAMSSAIYENNPRERLDLLAKVLKTLWLSPCGRLATLVVSRRMMRAPGVDESMTDGFVNHARGIRGVEVAAELREISAAHYRVSLRSRGRVNVSLLAAEFGGGGHVNAAGCRMRGSARQIREQLARRLEELLGASC